MLALGAVTLGPGVTLAAQQPTPRAQVAEFASYAPPTIALVQPPAGGAVPQDRPIVVLRVTQGEVADAIDLRSLLVTVDGQDRTGLFKLTVLPSPNASIPMVGEAWGALAPDGAPIPAGSHHVTARICSSRGACGEVAATVIVAAAPSIDSGSPANPRDRRRRVLDAILSATRKIFVP